MEQNFNEVLTNNKIFRTKVLSKNINKVGLVSNRNL